MSDDALLSAAVVHKSFYMTLCPSNSDSHDSLSFREVNYVEAFQEYEYELIPASPEICQLIVDWGTHSVTKSDFYPEDVETLIVK